MRGGFRFPDGRTIPQKRIEGGLQLHFPNRAFFRLEDVERLKIIIPKGRKTVDELLDAICALEDPVAEKHPGGLYRMVRSA
jgi:hypothetical protein